MMSVEQARALALAYELHVVLGELYDKSPGAGSRIERAYDAVDDVISALDDADGLRFVKASPAPKLASLVLAHRYRWKEPSAGPVTLPD
jgi:hypothetical protein